MSVSFSPSQVATILYILHNNHGGPTFDEKSVLAQRAYSRFIKEFEYYQFGKRNMSEVRKYHRLLTAALREVDTYLKIQERIKREEIACSQLKEAQDAGFASYRDLLFAKVQASQAELAEPETVKQFRLYLRDLL